MAKSRKFTPERKTLIAQLLESYPPEDVPDIQSMLKCLLLDTLHGMLESELDDELGYSRYDYVNKDPNNSRNSYSKKNCTLFHGRSLFRYSEGLQWRVSATNS